MAKGILGSVELPGATDTEVYAVPADNFCMATINFVNKNNTSVNVRLAFAKPGNALPEADDYIEYDTEILPNGVLERTGIILDTGRKVFARASGANVGVMVFGLETSTV